MKLTDIAELNAGTPQSRIKETLETAAPTYFIFGQAEMRDDLTTIETSASNSRQVRTFDNVATVQTGDLVFGLISGKAAIVSQSHNGYLYTQNYIKLSPVSGIDPKYLAYILNEDTTIKHQLQNGQQGSITPKFTIKQLSNLTFSPPPLTVQKVIGKLYFNQLALEALKKRVAIMETILVINKIRHISHQQNKKGK
jgi:restriction endonuclease S subunit